MKDDESAASFGCERCWPASADAAWEARRRLGCDAGLIDESHLHVMILACPACSQRFVSVFTERIDWADGDDPQDWSVLPVTATEAADLALRRDSLTEAQINALGPGRRCLRRDYPKGGTPLCYWHAGICVSPHD